MTRKIYTAADVLALNPCATWRDRIPGLIGEGLTARQIAGRIDVGVEWRRWVLVRLLYRVDPKELVLWACDCAVSVLDECRTEETRDAAECAIQTAVAWTEGQATDEDARAASSNAWSAAALASAVSATTATYAAAYAATAADRAASPTSTAYAAAFASAYADAETALSWLVLRLEASDKLEYQP